MCQTCALSTASLALARRKRRKEALRGESLSGPPPRRIGIRDVAQRAGVAISTVSKVFSGKGEVMPALRLRVLTAAAELGYQPNFLAQSLRRGATELIGFVAPDLSDPFSAEIVAGAEFVIRPAGYALLVMSSGHDPETEAANVRYLNSRRVDAVLVSPTREDDRGLLAALGEFDGPIVAIEAELPSPLAFDAVCADHRQAMREAVDHLFRLGHRQIAALTGPVDRRAGRERLAGLLEGLRARGGEDGARPVFTEHDAAAAEAETLRLLDGVSPPTALIAGGLQLLVGTLRALGRRGRVPGRDIALVGWDDGPLAELSRPPLAVVDRCPRELGAAAARLALKRLGEGGVRHGAPAEIEIRRARFIPRASLGEVTAPGLPSGGFAHG
jgi:LacI family transcriptional regulator